MTPFLRGAFCQASWRSTLLHWNLMVQTALTNQNRINSALLGQFQSLLRFRSEECFNNGPPARWEWRSHLDRHGQSQDFASNLISVAD